MLEAAGLNSQTAPVFVQSFEPGSLKYLRDHGLKTKVVQLIDAADVDLKTGELIYAVPSDRPYEWTLAGDKRLYSAMVTAAGLAEIKTYADGIGPWKRYIVSIKGQLAPDGSVIDSNGDGKRNDADAQTTPPTDLVARAHAAGLFVHPYTFRNEKRRLAQDYAGDPKAEFLQFFRLGVDGLFTDFADTALAARTDFLAQPSR
jgi:glycerophosphoryl diester phosphodiesterase